MRKRGNRLQFPLSSRGFESRLRAVQLESLRAGFDLRLNIESTLLVFAWGNPVMCAPMRDV